MAPQLRERVRGPAFGQPVKGAASVVAVIALAAVGCGGGGDAVPTNATGAAAARVYGGPLKNPSWDAGGSDQGTLRPERPGGRAYAGFGLLINRGKTDAVVEDIRLIGASRNLRLIGIYTAGGERDSIQSDSYVWPPRPDEIPPSTIRPARGTIVPPKKTAHVGPLGAQILVAVELPRAGRYGFRGIRVDYRVGRRRYRVDVPTSYRICTPRRLKCPLPKPYRPET